jgi:hypothetical protein
MSSPFRKFMVCISGYSGSGKDEFAKVLVDEQAAPKVGLADPAKRHMADLYGFTEHQLFGPSAARNAGDVRYPKPSFFSSGLTVSQASSAEPPNGLSGELEPNVPYWEFESRRGTNGLSDARAISKLPYVNGRLGNAKILVPEGHPSFWLSPRESLQRYCELMNTLYGDSWIRKAINNHMRLGGTAEIRGHRFMSFAYDRMFGLVVPSSDKLVPAPEDGGSFFSCSADFRHKHEFNLARKTRSEYFIPVMVRVKRPSVPAPPFDHRSETEQATIPDSFFDFVVENDKTVEDLHDKTREIVRAVQAPGWQPLGGTL